MAVDLAKIFTYPYDNDLLMRKQKSIRRALLARENVSYTKKRVAILGGSTTDDIKNILELFLLEAGISPTFYQSEYNRYYEDAVFGAPELEDFQPEIIIIYTSAANIINKPQLNDTLAAVKTKVQSEIARYRKVHEKLARFNAVIIQNNFERPPYDDLGSLSFSAPYGMARFINLLNEALAAETADFPNVYLHDLNTLAARVGTRWHNLSQYYAYKLAQDYDFIPLAALGIAKIIRAILGKNKKCLVLDLDNTLWGGIIGDDGVDGIAIGHETPLAESFTAWQTYVRSLKERGVILAVCSKNNDEVARSGFTHPDSVLKADDFIAFYANWQPKNINIQAIARDINIGTDSLVFIDDNPAEREIVRQNLPEVAVPEVASCDIASYIQAIEGAGYFEPAAISADDLKRSATYQENKARKELLSSAEDYDTYLASLAMHAEIDSFVPVYYDRIAQLTNKSNQFNLTTIRYTRADIERMATDDKYITLYGRLEDKFGDNGLVSVVIGQKIGDSVEILLWLMSCRVLKRGMENAMLDALVERAKAVGARRLLGKFIPTKKNKMVAELFDSFGFTRLSEDENGVRDYVLVLGSYSRQGRFIRRSTRAF